MNQYIQTKHLNITKIRFFVRILVSLIISSTLVIEITAQNSALFITSVAWSPDGNKIAVGYGTDSCESEHPEYYAVKVFDSQTAQLLQTLTGSLCRITSIDWSSDGNKLVASSGDSVGVRVWNIQTGQLVMSAQRGGQGVTEARWQPPNNALLAVATVSNGTAILDPTTGETLGSAFIGGTTLDWSPDGNKVLSASFYESTVYVADFVAGQQILTLQGHTGMLGTVDWSPDGTKLASGSLEDSTIRLWDAVTGQILVVLEGHTGAISEIKWSPDSSRLASASSDGTVRIWEVSTGEELETFQYPGRVYTVDWSPDGSRLVYGGQGSEGQDAQIEIVDASQIITCDIEVAANNATTLVTAIGNANILGTPQTLCLEGTYNLTTSNNSGSDGSNDLPVITSDITLHGLGAGAEIIGTLQVSGTGRLTLRNVTVTP